ncbi:MAG TPA: YbaK/EbsC family protein [Gemmatimonadales bacterium]
MWGDQLKQHLDKNRVKYVTIAHSPAFTAQEVAATAHVPGREMAKTVMVKLDGKIAMAVLPASERVVFDLLRDATGAHSAELATEGEFASLFPGCERGAMPPFGNLSGLDVYVDRDLAADETIAFNAGSFTEVIQMRYADFARLVQPKVAKFAAES